MTTPTGAGQEPAPANTTPTGQAPANTPPATGTGAPWERDGIPFDAARAWSLIENLRTDLATARTGTPAAPAAPPATPPAPPAEPSAPPNMEGQLAELRAQVARERVGRKYALDDELIGMLGAGTDAEIEARGKALADRLAAAANPGSPVPRRPVESLPGSSGDPQATPEETDPLKLADLVRARAMF